MIQDFVLETSNAPGAATTINLAGAVAGRVAFSSKFTNGAAVFYYLDDGTQAEWGAGTFATGTPNTLTRQTVLGNTANNTNKLNFLGTARVYNEIPASRTVWLDNNGIAQATSWRLATGGGYFTADATNASLTFDTALWRLNYTRSNNTLAYLRGTDSAVLFSVDASGNATHAGTLTAGAITTTGTLIAPRFQLTTGSGYFTADATNTSIYFDSANWRWQYTRANGTLSYLRGSDSAVMFTIDPSGNTQCPGQSQAVTFRLATGQGYFTADASNTHLAFDSSNYRLTYARSTGTLTYFRGSDSTSLFSVNSSGNVTAAGAVTGASLQVSYGIGLYQNVNTSWIMWDGSNWTLQYSKATGRLAWYNSAPTELAAFETNGDFRILNTFRGAAVNVGAGGVTTSGGGSFTGGVGVGGQVSAASLLSLTTLVLQNDGNFSIGNGGAGRILNWTGNNYLEWNSSNMDQSHIVNGIMYWTVKGNATAGNPNGAVFGTAWVPISDRRLKDILSDEVEGLEELLRLKPVKYTLPSMTLEGKQPHRYAGFIADEVAECLPDALFELERDGEPMASYDSGAVMAVAVHAIQQLAATVTQLNERLQKLEGARA